MSGPAGRAISIWLAKHIRSGGRPAVYCETGHPVSGPSGYQYPTDWYPIRSGPGTEIDFGVIRPDAPDVLTGPVKTTVEMCIFREKIENKITSHDPRCGFFDLIVSIASRLC